MDRLSSRTALTSLMTAGVLAGAGAPGLVRWHTTGVTWVPTELSHQLNGRTVATVHGHSPTHAMWQGLQTATGSGPGAPDTSTSSTVRLQVDWVRAYRRS